MTFTSILAARMLPLAAGLCLLAGCAGVQRVKALVAGPASPYLSGYIGEVVADEPRATLVARDILARGGNAADAAAALGMSLSVTLPSRASLGAGGTCLAFDAGAPGVADAILFLPVAGDGSDGHVDRPASVPMLARGLFLLQARHGSVGFDELVRPAASLARHGITVSRALADDLAQVQAPLLADPGARAIFAPGGTALPQVGDRLVQPQLADTLDHIAQVGVGDLYTGALASDFVSGADAAGGGLDMKTMRMALPIARKPLLLDAHAVQIALPPPPAAGGQATRAAFEALGNDAPPPPPGATLPASTSFVVLDRAGDAVSCAISMDNLFGTGRVAGDTGIVLGASPARVSAPLLAAAIAWSKAGHDFRAAVAASGQGQAAGAAADALHTALDGSTPLVRPHTGAGRANAISCPGGLPGDSGSCVGETDPRGAGLAIGSN
ncbi:gamma-glutamyltransferase [Lichenicoccus sp.]|uniref:gamma-glutamyltransferase n=1 Tax=Lichenicoccus sp. TaxID=2781899 RepID=UPI003D1174E2